MTRRRRPPKKDNSVLIILVVVIAIVLIVGLGLIAGQAIPTSGSSSNRITYSQYEKAKLGMTRDEVTEIMGSPGRVSSSTAFSFLDAQTSSTVVVWGDPDGAYVVMAFLDDKLTQKAQSELP